MGKHSKESHNIKCDLCPFKTYRQSILKQHIRRRHDKLRKVYEIKCPDPDCEKLFKEKRYLRKHLLDVHGIIYKTD